MLSVVAGVSLVYDLAAGLLLLFATDSLASWFGAPLPNPVLFAKLDGLFLIAVGLGYLQPLFRPEAHRAYLWVFGVLLKGAGAIVITVDHFVHASPMSFLLFAVSDGFLAVWTLAALLRKDAPALPSNARTTGKPGSLPG